MRILMTGATGLIGRELGQTLVARGDTLVCLVRDPGVARRRLPFAATCHAWDHTRPVPAEALREVDAVINLAGEPVADARWSAAKKALVRDSRVQGTRQLVRAVLDHGRHVTAFVQGSAIGYYGDGGDLLLSPASPKGTGFLADLVQAWEAEVLALAAQRPAVRVPVVRTGVVLARQGGALAEMLPLFRLSAAGRLGDGRQWLSWIHLDDIVRLFVHALDAAGSGVLEGVAPHPVTNRAFTSALCRALGVIENLPAPRWVIQALYGERADVVLGSTRLAPVATRASGFEYRFETVGPALDDLLLPLRGGVVQRVWTQWVPHTAQAVWPLLCGANALEELTPPWLGLRVLGLSTPDIAVGTLIDCRLRPHGLPLNWQTRIEAWDPPHRFVDRQVKGPYAQWHHMHEFIPSGSGTLLRDTLHYRLPAGWLGTLAGSGRVAADVERIFDHRSRQIDARLAA